MALGSFDRFSTRSDDGHTSERIVEGFQGYWLGDEGRNSDSSEPPIASQHVNFQTPFQALPQSVRLP